MSKMKLIVTIFGLMLFFQLNAQNSKTVAYIDQYKEIAINEMIRSGVYQPPLHLLKLYLNLNQEKVI
jgi:uncharacterized membrane protein